MIKLKKDRYAKVRGQSNLLNILCINCRESVLIYQKDGTGSLIRMYKDRIVSPKSLVEELENISDKKDMKIIKCPKCGNELAIPMIYKKENRLAYRVIPGRIIKEKI